ncbi:DMT family transporter [Cytobacillus sp. Hm23]
MEASKYQSTSIYFLLLLVPLFWGGAFGASKHVVTEIPPMTAGTLRFGSAAIILLLLVIYRSEWSTEKLKRHWFGLTCMALTGIFLYNGLFFLVGLKYTSEVNGALIMATTPAFLTMGAVIFLNEKFNRRLGLGLFLSLSGVLIVIFKGIDTISSLSFNKGDLLFVGGLICWVIHGLIGKVVMRDVSSTFTTCITMLIGTILLAVFSLIEGGWIYVTTMSAQSWIEISYMSIFASVVAFLLWNEGIRRIGTSKSSIYMNLVPINAAWISVVLYGSTLTVQQIIGMFIVILGVYIATSNERNIVKKS